jgi:alpha-tubulin suppressor-like RCC1 family protein
MSAADMAAGYVRSMIEKETAGWGDTSNALHRISAKYQLPFHTLINLRTGRSKTVEHTIFNKIRGAYISVCLRQLEKLQHEIAIEKAKGSDDAFEDIASEAEMLAALVEKKRALMR